MLLYNGFYYIARDSRVGIRKLKVGDLVRIKSLKVVREVKERGYDLPGHFNDAMEKYCGKLARILQIDIFGGDEYYRLDIDNQDWQWSEHMFDLEERHITMENE